MHELATKTDIVNYILFVFRKRKGLFLLTGLTTFLSIVFFTYLVTPTWEGTTKILVERNYKQNLSIFKDVNLPAASSRNQENLELLNILTGENMAYDIVREFALDERLQKKRFNPKNFREKAKNTIVDIVMSPLTLLQAAGILPEGEKNWLDSAVEDLIEDQQDIEAEEGTAIIQITINGESQQLAADIANRMVELLREKTRSFAREGAKTSYEFVRNQVMIAEINLREAELNLTEFKKENNIVLIEEEKKLKLARLNRIESDLSDAVDMYDEEDVDISEIESDCQFQLGGALLSKVIAENPVATELKTSLDSLEMKIASLLYEKKEEHPEVKGLRAEIRKNKEALKFLVRNILAGQVEELKRLKSDLKLLSDKEMKLASFQEVMNMNRSIYQALMQRLQELSVEKESINNEYTIRVLDRAYVSPDASPDWPMWPVNVIAGIFLALVFGLGGIFFVEYWNDTVLKPQDVEKELSLPFLGEVPKLKRRFRI